MTNAHSGHRFIAVLALVLVVLAFPAARAGDDDFEEGGSQYTPCTERPAPLSLAPGERLEYQVRFLGTKAGEATIEIADMADLNGVACHHLTAHIRSTGFYAMVYPADLHYQCWIDAKTLLPVRVVHDQVYENLTEKKTWDYLPATGKVWRERIKDYTKNSKDRHYKSEYAWEPGIDEEFLTLHRLRGMGCPPGSEFLFRIFSDKEIHSVGVRVVKETIVGTKLGKLPCTVYEPFYRGEATTEFGKNTRLQLFYGKQAPHYLARVRIKLWVGNLTGTLVRAIPGKAAGSKPFPAPVMPAPASSDTLETASP